MKMLQRIGLAIALLGSNLAYADELNRNEVIAKIAEEIIDQIDDADLDSDTSLQLVFSRKTEDLTGDHVQTLETRIEAELLKDDYKLSDKGPGYRVDISLTDEVNSLSDSEEHVTLTINTQIAEAQAKKFSRVNTVEYKIYAQRESYVIRDALTTTMITTSVISGIGAIVYAGKASNASVDADSDKEKGQTEAAERHKSDEKAFSKTAGQLLGVSIASGVLAYLFKPEKDSTVSYEFELVSDGFQFNDTFAVSLAYSF